MTYQTNAPIEHTSLSATFRRASELATNVEEGHLDLDPPYQRGDVWVESQRIGLVRSWLTGIPTGVVILSDRTNRNWGATCGEPGVDEPIWACVDGRQRITTAISWFSGGFAVPASWIDPQYVDVTESTSDGLYVRYTGLTTTGQRMLSSRASIQVAEYRWAGSLADEASMYLLVNGAGTPQEDADSARARRAAKGSAI